MTMGIKVKIFWYLTICSMENLMCLIIVINRASFLMNMIPEVSTASLHHYMIYSEMFV